VPATAVGLLCGVLAAVTAWVLSPNPKFTARALVEMPEPGPRVVNGVQQNQVGLEAFQRMQLSLVKSRSVLRLVLDDPKVATLGMVRKKVAEEPDPAQWLEREIQADFSKGPDILRISINGENGEELLKVTNAVTKTYVAQAFHKEFKKRSVRLEKLRKLEEFYAGKLKDKQKELKGAAEMAQGGAGDNQLLINKLPVLQIPLEAELKHLQEVHSRKRELELKVAYYQEKEWSVWPAQAAPLAALPQPGLPVNLALIGLAVTDAAGRVELPGVEAAVEATIANQDGVKKAQEQVNILADSVKRHVRISGEKAPVVAKERKALREAQRLLAAERARVRGEVIMDLRQRGVAEARRHRRQVETELEMLLKLEAMIQKHVELLQRDDQKLGLDAFGAANLRREVEALEGILKTVRASIDNEELQQEVQLPEATAEEAVLYREVGKTRQLALTGLAGAGSLALVVLGFSLWEFRRRRVSSPDEVVTGLGMRLVGALPDLALRHGRPHLLGGGALPEDRWQELLAASVDSVRTTLLHAERHYGVRVVVITSAVAGEGKTSLSCHLAASMERAGRRTLLVDGDMRAPTAHGLFGLQRSPGLAEVLRGEVSLAEAVQPVPALGGLSFLAAGRADAAAIQALAQPRMAELLRQIRGQYDFVLVDSCPVLPVADALLFGQLADAVIFSVLRDISRLPKVYAAYQRVGTLGIPILGAVVSGARDELYAAGYHYAYAPAAEEPAAGEARP
jgi:capsular exopolysaccharide synthesis family protein